MHPWWKRLIRGPLALLRGGDFPGPTPRDPLTGVRHPVARRPGGRDSAAAVEEPEERDVLVVVSR